MLWIVLVIAAVLAAFSDFMATMSADNGNAAYAKRWRGASMTCAIAGVGLLGALVSKAI